MKKKDVSQIKASGEQGIEPLETFFVTEIQNKKTWRRLTRTLLAGTDNHL